MLVKIFKNLVSSIFDKNAYDIQQYCIETAAVEPEKFFAKADLDKLKQFAFNQGNPFQYYSSMFGIIIRDKYLQIKGISISEVDINDPKLQ